jgi:hypothetical protein
MSCVEGRLISLTGEHVLMRAFFLLFFFLRLALLILHYWTVKSEKYVGPSILFRDDKTHCNIMRKNVTTNML